MRNFLLRAMLPLALVMLTACAGTSPSKSGDAAKGDETVLMERALARWNLLIKRDAFNAWEYLSPGYRATHPQDIYAREMGQRPVQWSAAAPYEPREGNDAKPVECDASGQSCQVRVKLNFKFRSQLTSVGMLDSSSVVLERWIRVKGQWYLVPKDVAG